MHVACFPCKSYWIESTLRETFTVKSLEIIIQLFYDTFVRSTINENAIMDKRLHKCLLYIDQFFLV